jgi:hypothetical protein
MSNDISSIIECHSFFFLWLPYASSSTSRMHGGIRRENAWIEVRYQWLQLQWLSRSHGWCFIWLLYIDRIFAVFYKQVSLRIHINVFFKHMNQDSKWNGAILSGVVICVERNSVVLTWNVCLNEKETHMWVFEVLTAVLRSKFAFVYILTLLSLFTGIEWYK